VLTAIGAVAPDVGADNPGCDPVHWDADPMPTTIICNRQVLLVFDQNGGCLSHVFVIRDGVPRAVSGTFKSYQYRDADGINCDGPVLQNTVWTPNHRYIGSTPALPKGYRTVDWQDNRPGETIETLLLPNNFDAHELTAQTQDSVTFTYRPTQTPEPADRIEQKTYQDLLARDGEARRTGNGETVVWHGYPVAFTKTFTLQGTTLRVVFDGVSPGLVIDSEFCVDLLDGALGGALLTREPSAEGIVIRGSTGGAIRIGTPAGGHFTEASLLSTVLDAGANGDLGSDFLALHRVLTDAVRIEADSPHVEYEIELLLA